MESYVACSRCSYPRARQWAGGSSSSRVAWASNLTPPLWAHGNLVHLLILLFAGASSAGKEPFYPLVLTCICNVTNCWIVDFFFPCRLTYPRMIKGGATRYSSSSSIHKKDLKLLRLYTLVVGYLLRMHVCVLLSVSRFGHVFIYYISILLPLQ